jgi:hypothetical protein
VVRLPQAVESKGRQIECFKFGKKQKKKTASNNFEALTQNFKEAITSFVVSVCLSARPHGKLMFAYASGQLMANF